MQHSKLIYEGATGAMNESFSDMSDQAIQYYLTGKNDWRHGKDIIKDPVEAGCTDLQDCAERYMDEPTKDGKSYDDVIKAVNNNPNVHYSSGVFNKMFYLLATHSGWNTKMAFDVMVHANQHYWTMGDGSSRGYKEIACGILAATKDYQAKDSRYDVQAVIAALKGVNFQDGGNPSELNYAISDIKNCE